MPFLPAPQEELKKHVGAIHIRGRISLLQRKVSNVLLLNAYEELLREDSHRIRVKDLARAAGFDSKNIRFLKDTLRQLVDIKVEWNILDQEGKEEWGISSLLSGVKIYRGVCSYSYSPFLRERLYNPEIYARINLSIQRKFRSGYAISLYENCVRFKNLGTTGWFSLETWRELLGVEEDQYLDFRDFKRRVLTPAVKEINEYSDITVEVAYQRKKRRVVGLKFDITPKAQLQMDFDEGLEQTDAPVEEAEIETARDRLLEFGLTPEQTDGVLSAHKAEYIHGNLDYVEGQVRAGKIRASVSAYTLEALRVDFRPRASEIEKKQQQKARAARVAAKVRRKTRQDKETKELQEAEAKRLALEKQFNALDKSLKNKIDKQALARLKDEIPFMHETILKALKEGVEVPDMSPAMRATFQQYRFEEMQALSATPA